jgi:hypothetical protein
MASHPAYTCPRIVGLVLTDDFRVYSIEFMDPSEWAIFVKERQQG